MAMISATTVTHKELRIKGKKPNLPSHGAHSEEVMSVPIDRPSKSPVDFTMSPAAIASGNMRKNIKQTTIHLEDTASSNFRLVIVPVLSFSLSFTLVQIVFFG